MKKHLDLLIPLFAFALGACGKGNTLPVSSTDMAQSAAMNDLAMNDLAMNGDGPTTGACGAVGQPCCSPGNTCTDVTSTCTNGMCVLPTGAPCTVPADCDGVKPTCITKDAQGNPWPGGYCSSQCNPQKNDLKTGFNANCPGGVGTCSGMGAQGSCYSYCTGTLSTPNDHPCTRMGYLCFGLGGGGGCEPSDFSECSPDKPASCPQDGGVFYPAKTDGGQPSYSGRSCTLIGNDLVGSCADGCDIFAQNCANSMGSPQGCFADDISGAGTCTTLNSMGQDGDACIYTNDCNPGLGCYYNGGGATGMGLCRPYCRTGANPIACTNGKTCIDHSKTVKSTLVGSCAG